MAKVGEGRRGEERGGEGVNNSERGQFKEGALGGMYERENRKWI